MTKIWTDYGQLSIEEALDHGHFVPEETLRNYLDARSLFYSMEELVARDLIDIGYGTASAGGWPKAKRSKKDVRLRVPLHGFLYILRIADAMKRLDVPEEVGHGDDG